MPLSLEPERHRTVIDQRQVHISAKFAACNTMMHKPRPFHEVGEEATRVLRSCRCAEAGAPAVSRVGRECELRDEENCATDSAHIEVHAPRCVGKDAIAEEALEEPVRIAWFIGAPYAHERNDALLDRRDNALGYAHFGAGDPLDEGDHGAPILA